MVETNELSIGTYHFLLVANNNTVGKQEVTILK